MGALEAAVVAMRRLMGPYEDAPREVVLGLLRHLLRDEMAATGPQARDFWRTYALVRIEQQAQEAYGWGDPAVAPRFQSIRDGTMTLRELHDALASSGRAPMDIRMVSLLDVRNEIMREMGGER